MQVQGRRDLRLTTLTRVASRLTIIAESSNVPPDVVGGLVDRPEPSAHEGGLEGWGMLTSQRCPSCISPLLL